MKKLLYFFLALILIAASFIGVFRYYYFTPNNLDTAKIIYFEPGIGSKKIAKELENQGVIKYWQIFYLAVITNQKLKHQFLQSGEYKFQPNTSPKQVFSKIANGDIYYRQITIPEGLNIHQIKEIFIDAEGLIGEFPHDLKEGSILPETYNYKKGDDHAAIINRMKLSLSQTKQEAVKTKPEDHPLDNHEDIVILASIVEKETDIPAERTHIAGVFINRIKKGMKLQSDPTVIYAITDGKYQLKRRLTRKDLSIESPYNTYFIEGLPPSPIATPGADAIKAAMNPKKTSDLYFVATGSGGHYFASTLAEHNANVAKYREYMQNNGQY